MASLLRCELSLGQSPGLGGRARLSPHRHQGEQMWTSADPAVLAGSPVCPQGRHPVGAHRLWTPRWRRIADGRASWFWSRWARAPGLSSASTGGPDRVRDSLHRRSLACARHNGHANHLPGRGSSLSGRSHGFQPVRTTDTGSHTLRIGTDEPSPAHSAPQFRIGCFSSRQERRAQQGALYRTERLGPMLTSGKTQLGTDGTDGSQSPELTSGPAGGPGAINTDLTVFSN